MPEKIQPRTLKGFRDYLPAAMIPREWLVDTARRVYRSYGFAPIDTPALEYLEVLTGKGSDETDKQLYRFQDHGGRDVGLRFDLTVPLARFAAQHIQELGTPFKRYHIANVWRGENTQRGRYREFMQCDFDTIGTESTNADIEMVLVVHDLFSAIGFTEFTIHANNRKVLNGLLEKLGLKEKSTPVLRALDKLAKAGPEVVAAELTTAAGATTSQIDDILHLASLAGTNDQILTELGPLLASSEIGERGLAELAEITSALAAVGIPSARFKIDVGIARGLDYYTGTVLETFIDELPGIGSVCSGGRYDNLAELYTKEHLPGVGASLGLDRLLAAMEELGRVEKIATPAPVFLPFFDAKRRNDYLKLAAQVRRAGIGVEFYPEARKLGKQLQYADKRGFRVALIAGENELTASECQVKDLATGGSTTVSTASNAAAVIAEIRQILGR
jgi:histidyl-tRNA synthetase